MKGITEERLKELIFKDFNCDLIMADEAIDECKELNPWQSISNQPPEHHRVLVRFDDGQMEVARLVNGDWLSNDNLDYDYGDDIPTHWQELPEDPKE